MRTSKSPEPELAFNELTGRHTSRVAAALGAAMVTANRTASGPWEESAVEGAQVVDF